MMRYILILALLFPSIANAIGGVGATCNPTTANWGSCVLAPVPFEPSIFYTINVAGGSFATPYVASQANTRYVLQGDVTAAGGGIVVDADYVVIDLNGYTITYNVSSRGEGVTINGSQHHIAVRNGSIIQSSDNAGKIVSVAIGAGGTGYTVNDVLTLDGPTDATVTVTAVDGSGVITGISLTAPGLGFEVTAAYRDANGFQGPVTGGTGTGAKINVTGTISEGGINGEYRNPVGTYNSAVGGIRDGSDSHISNLYLRYGGRDVGGARWTGNRVTVEQVTTEDLYEFGTLKHRDYGVTAIFGNKYATIKNNTILSTRHKGIHTEANAVISGNHITIRSIATNSYGILGYNAQDVSVFSNTIIGRGEMPIGIGYVSAGTNNIEVYDNYADVKTTALGVEYASAYLANPLGTFSGNNAAGFRTTWGGNNLNVHDNQFVVTSDSNFTGTFSPTGAVAYIKGQGHGIWAGIAAGETATFSNNIISALNDDGAGEVNGIACLHNFSDSLYFIGNTVTSNLTNIAFDKYGTGCQGYPLFQDNTLIKSGSFETYKTIADRFTGYWINTGRFVDNVYQDGAAEDNIDLNPEGSKSVSIFFGSASSGQYLYSYQLSDADDTSLAIVRDDYDPPVTLGYAVPGSVPDLSVCSFEFPSLCVTQATCEAMAGLYWCDGACRTQVCEEPLPDPPSKKYYKIGPGIVVPVDSP